MMTHINSARMTGNHADAGRLTTPAARPAPTATQRVRAGLRRAVMRAEATVAEPTWDLDDGETRPGQAEAGDEPSPEG